MRHRVFLMIPLVILLTITLALGREATVKEALMEVKTLEYPANGRMVDKTVVDNLKQNLIPSAQAMVVSGASTNANVLRVCIADEGLVPDLSKLGIKAPSNKDWMWLRLTANGEGELVASKANLLYMLYCQLRDKWLDKKVVELEKGVLTTTTFSWVEGSDGNWPFRAITPRRYDAETSIQELARLGCDHVVVNAVANIAPFEQGPPGEIYYRFYYGNTDLDQYAETELSKGIYPPEYLQANMNFTKENAKLAAKYGLTPGLFITAPRSVQDALLERYPFLRGARIDHTFRCYKPRYTLTLAHPVVRWHYAELMKQFMREIPELAYLGWRTNDAGAGFEYTVTTYAGRNGGPYLIREWKSNEEIAKTAGANVLRYIKLLRDAASEINPNFRVISGLGSFPAEGQYILDGMGDRLDLSVSLADTADPVKWKKQADLLQKGAYLFSGAGLTSPYIQGIPFPWLCFENLRKLVAKDLRRIGLGTQSICLASYDINRQVFHAYQLNEKMDIDQTIMEKAQQWVGAQQADKLVQIWRTIDQVVRDFPSVPLYDGYGFYTLRPWVRPFVPDIGKIPTSDRAYYEQFLNAIFNNPNLVDLAADALWTLISTEQAESIIKQCDSKIWQPLDEAIALCESGMKSSPVASAAYHVFLDQRDRLLGQKYYYRTLRNLAMWIAGVHGYVDAKEPAVKQTKQAMVKEMMADEIANTKALLKLFRESQVDFMPLSDISETMYDYCSKNFAELLEKKIALMEKHKNDVPHINPNFMWQMPDGFGVDENEYLKY